MSDVIGFEAQALPMEMARSHLDVSVTQSPAPTAAVPSLH